MQTPTSVLNVGADVAKDEFVVACSEGSFSTRPLANQRSALQAFLKKLPAGSCIGMESTGIYHELFANLAHKLGFVVFVLNPKDARHYAKGVGMRGKTDRVDAELLARMIAHEHTKLHAWLPPTPEQYEIDQLIKRRAKLSSLRAALGMSLKGVDGFGPVVSAALVNTLERVPLQNSDAFVAFTGLDPRPDDSGHHRGKRRLSKRGPSELRRLLFLAALSAAKTKAWHPL